MNNFHYLIKKYGIFLLFFFLLIRLGFIPIKTAITLYKSPPPQAILVLGGSSNREKFTAKFAQNHPSLNIWVSTGIPCKKAKKIFREAGISEERINLDYRALDTVTNFTSLQKDFKQYNIQHLYLITSNYHMPRAKVIATIVLGNQGIIFTPVQVPSERPKESFLRIIRDIFRSIFWIMTGHTGASLNPNLPFIADRKCNHQ